MSGPLTGSGTTSSLLVRAAAAPAVLVLVLVSHVALRSSSDLTPWKGGGFGMFSTIDSPATRIVRVELETDVGTVPVAVPSRLKDLVGAAKSAPSPGRLEHLAAVLAGQWWVVPVLTVPDVPAEDEALRDLAVQALSQVVPVDTVRAIDPAQFDEVHQRRIAVDAVHVSVLRLTTSAEDQALRPRTVRAVSLDVAPGTGSGGR